MTIDKTINFPNIKINIGLDIVKKREDGFHDIETVFYPINFYDSLEIMPSDKFELVNHGIKIDCPTEKNLCYKAYELLKATYGNITPVKIILYKHVPFGSGLGAGSSNAAFTLMMLNEMFELNISESKMLEYASTLGADCAFFIKNKAVFAQGRGNVFSDLNIDLKGKFLALAIPNISVNTAMAYKMCKPQIPESCISDNIKLPIENWKNKIKNDFEDVVFYLFPQLKSIKEYLYSSGAIFAQMSGSGSSIYGIFDKKPKLLNFENCKIEIIEL